MSTSNATPRARASKKKARVAKPPTGKRRSYRRSGERRDYARGLVARAKKPVTDEERKDEANRVQLEFTNSGRLSVPAAKELAELVKRFDADSRVSLNAMAVTMPELGNVVDWTYMIESLARAIRSKFE